jgi:hypothetical protein
MGFSLQTADCCPENAGKLVRRDAGGNPAIHESSGFGASLAAGFACSKPFSRSSIGHLDMRTRRYGLLVVDSLVAHPRNGSRRSARAVGSSDSGKVLTHSHGAGRFWSVPTGPVGAARHF